MLSRLRGNDRGVTLIELLVGMTLAVTVGAIATQFFVGTTAQANRVGQQTQSAASARVAMTQIVKTLQVADSSTTPGVSTNRFVCVSSTEVRFYSDVSSSNRSGTSARATPTEVDFSVVNGTLWESTYPTGTLCNTSTAPTTHTVLLTGLVNPASAPVFTFCSDATDPSVSCTATSNPASVAFVQIALVAGGLSGTTSQTVQSGVAINGVMS